MEALMTFLNEASQKEVIHYGLFFTFAALMHAKQVRKEIASQFSILSDALNNVANTLKEELTKHSQRLDSVEKEVIGIKYKLNQKGE